MRSRLLTASAGKGFNLLIDLKRLIIEMRVHPSANASDVDAIQNEVQAKGMLPEIVKPSELSAH